MIVMTEQIVAIRTKRNATTDEVFRLVAAKVGLLPENWEFFALFEIVEHNFERKISATEFPHSLYIANYSTAAATCLTLRKWLFHPRVEVELHSDQVLQLSKSVYEDSLTLQPGGVVAVVPPGRGGCEPRVRGDAGPAAPAEVFAGWCADA